MRILLYTCFYMIRMVFMLVHQLVWRVNGTYKHLQNTRHIDYYPVSAQILNIHVRHKFDTVDESPSLINFITSHHAFVHPKYILQDHVTLYCLHHDVAVFVETDQDVDVTSVEFGAFLRISQYEYAKRLVLLPLHAFNRVAKELGPPQSQVIVVSNTSRCGSTLMCQLFQQTGCCVALSEPDPPNTLVKLNLRLPHDDTQQLASSTVNILCKKIHHRNIRAFIIKLSAVSPDAVPLLNEACPFIQHLFLYRDGLKVAQSLARAIKGGFAMANLAFNLAKLSPRITRAMIEDMGFSLRECDVNSSEPLVWTFFLWAHTVKKYLEWRADGIDIVAVRYEDLQADQSCFLRSILQHFDLPPSWEKRALSGMALDSQRHSRISRDALSKMPLPELTPLVHKMLNDMCWQLGLPQVGEPCILEGTISGSTKLINHTK